MSVPVEKRLTYLMLLCCTGSGANIAAVAQRRAAHRGRTGPVTTLQRYLQELSEGQLARMLEEAGSARAGDVMTAAGLRIPPTRRDAVSVLWHRLQNLCPSAALPVAELLVEPLVAPLAATVRDADLRAASDRGRAALQTFAIDNSSAATALLVAVLAESGRVSAEARDRLLAAIHPRRLAQSAYGSSPAAAVGKSPGGAEQEATPPTRSRSRAPVRVLFVGGNEAQRRYYDVLDEVLARRHAGTVTVEWFPIGWTRHSIKPVERVEARFADADIVVIMAFTPTEVGRRLRRSAGAAGLPWLTCTGHGRASIERAIDQAVAVVIANRERS